MTLPTGTVTFLFSDIEGSTKLLQSIGAEPYRLVLEQHARVIRDAIASSGGQVVSTEGDSFFAVFASAPDAVAAAAAAQTNMKDAGWPEGVEIKVRMGLHTGEGTLGGDNYLGLDVHRAARIAAVGHGGQVLLSEATRLLVEDTLTQPLSLKDLGEHRLKDLSRPERIHQLRGPGLESDFQSLRSLDARPNNLPIQVTSFVGRGHEVARVKELVEGNRLVTLTGPGGTGKTRLALQVAAESGDAYPDGVFFVALATIADPDLVASKIADTLGLVQQGGDARTPIQRVLDFVGDKRMLLVMDNFEQVLDAAASVGDLVRGAADLKVVVTSRAALHVYGEVDYLVPPLGLPDPLHLPDLAALSQFEAVALFIQRAVAAKPDFRVTNSNAPAVAEICARLDGLPLAIELAAARVRLLSPESILARLGQRLKLLIDGARDLPQRQQTLRQAIAWSFDLLEPAEKQMFARLAVFVGGFTIQAVERVVGPSAEDGSDVLDDLTSLLDKSLIRTVAGDGGDPRFTMLETIREFSLERLDEEEGGTRRRHALFFTEQAEEAASRLTASDRSLWYDTLEREHDNIRAALQWLVESGDRESAARLFFAFWRFWQTRGPLAEGCRRITDVLALFPPGDRSASRAKVLEAAGGLEHWTGDISSEVANYREALDIWREIGDPAEVANALYNLAFPLALEADTRGEAFTSAQEMLRMVGGLGDSSGEAKAHWVMGFMDMLSGDPHKAQPHVAQALEAFRETGDVYHTGWALHSAGQIAMSLGKPEAALEAWREALELFRDDVSGIIFMLDNLSYLAQTQGDLRTAARLAGAVRSLSLKSGVSLFEKSALVREEDEIDFEDSEPSVRRHWEEGRAMDTDEAVAFALGRTPTDDAVPARGG